MERKHALHHVVLLSIMVFSKKLIIFLRLSCKMWQKYGIIPSNITQKLLYYMIHKTIKSFME